MSTPFPELESYLPGARAPRQPTAVPTTSTWLDREMERQRDDQIRDGLITAPAPDAVARTEKVARDTGSSVLDVQGNEDMAERGFQVQRLVDLAQSHAPFGRWASQNPRGAAMAADDHESLSMLGKAWEDIKNIPSALRTSWDTLGVQGSKVNASIAEAFGNISDELSALASPNTQTVGGKRARQAARADYWDAGVGNADALTEGRRATYQTYLGQQIIGSGLESLVPSLGAAGIGALTRSPSLATALMAGTVGGPAYYDARQKGLNAPDAIRYGIAQGGTEYVTERLPASTLVDMISRKTPFGKAVLRELGQEVVGENVATILQDLADWQYLPENRDKTVGQYLEERPQAALDTTLATLGGVAGNVSIVGAIQRAADATTSVADRTRDVRQARREREFIDRAAQATAASRLRQRDPEAYRTLIREQAADAGATSVFIPGEAIQTYNQSDAYDPASDPLARSDAQEAAVTGGDVVMPIEDFLTDVVGTPAYDAIKDDIRLTQGGMSTREAQTFDEAMDDVIAHAADELARNDRADREARSTREQLVDRVAGMFGESFTSPVARQYAEIAVQRAQTRAQRLGTELSPDDLGDLVVRQVLPESVGEAISADRLDLVINALRAGANPTYGVGPSLLEFIRERGGVNDVGGDLTSMGVPSRFLTGFDPRQADMVGGVSGMGDFGIDNTLQAAIAAGYFPDLANAENEQGPSTIDTQRLLDAIGEELAGRPAYAETRTDDVRASAQDLRETLDAAGYAPANMTDDEIRDAVGRMGEQSQGGTAYEQEARGRVVFEQNRRVIELFQGRDLSTPIHELGHTWLEEMRADVDLETAPDQLRADWEVVRSWFAHSGHAVAEDGTIPVEAHELWARGVERYFMEGKAPTAALTRIFDNVRQWMLSIYKSVANLRTPITPEIREVFDRMLASDEEIAAARERQGIEELFKDAAEAGMSQAEFAAYQAKAQDANAAAHAKLLDKVMSTIRRRETERYREARRTVRAEEEERIEASPLYRALAAMDTRRDGNRISKEWIVDRMGLDALELLPRRVPPIFVEGGTNPDIIAEMAGYSSGAQMIEALIGADRVHRQEQEGGDKRSMRVRAIENATDQEMNRRYGDPLNDGSIEQEALAAVQSEMLGEVISSEIRALGRRTGQGPLPYQIARDWARGKVRSGKWIDVASPGALVRHARNAARAAKAAEAALVAGDHAEAYRQKQFQMLNNAMAAEAYLAADEVEAARKRMDGIAEAKTRKSVDQDYLEQAQMLLEAVDLKRRSQIYERRKGSFAAWASAREAEGYDVVMPESFAATIGMTNWSKMPVDDILMLDEAIKQIMHLGRMKQSLLDGQEERAWEAIEQEAVDTAAHLSSRPPSEMTDPTVMQAISSRVAGIDASLLKMETAFDWLDGGNPNGVFNRIVFRPIAAAQAREADMLKDYYARMKAHFEAIPPSVAARWQDRMVLPFIDKEAGIPIAVNRHKLIAMALNVGNEGNLQRLADGYGLNGGALVGYLDETLTQEEWQFVQNVWDTIDTLWPEISAMEKRVNGVAPDKVRARTFDTSTNGRMRGGYYPAVYDTGRDYRAEENAGKSSDLLESRYTKATTRASSTKARDEQVNRPLLLDIGVINRHLGEVIHDLTHREAVITANRFLSSEKVRRAVDGVLGREIGKQFRPWLKYVANSWAAERAGNEGVARFLGAMRANVTAVGMGLRATTMITQIGGYSNSMEVVGERWMAPAIARFHTQLVGSAAGYVTFQGRRVPPMVAFVMERSGEMRHRMSNLDRDLRTEIAKIGTDNPATKAWHTINEGRRFFFHGIGYMDMVVSVPTWMAAYDKALASGMSEADASYAADKAVRQSQGAGGAKDLAAVQRGNGKMGVAGTYFTMFYSFFSAQYQRQRTLARDVGGLDDRQQRNLPRLAARAFFLLILPPLLTEILRGSVGAPSGPDDDEWWTQWVARKLLANSLGPIPVVRDLFEPVWNGVRGGGWSGAQISPVQRVYDTMVHVGEDVGKIARGEETKQATKDAMEAVGYATGLVPGQVASATQFLVDIGYGDADPKGFGDWLTGMSTGKLPKD